MRNLNKHQKKILEEWMKKKTWLTPSFTIDDLDYDTYKEIEVINDHETITQNIERYVRDAVMDRPFNYFAGVWA